MRLAVAAAVVLFAAMMAAPILAVGGAQEAATAQPAPCAPAQAAYTGPLPAPGGNVVQARPGVRAGPVPPTVIPVYRRAAQQYGVPEPILEGVGWEETKHGATLATSSAGAKGFMQFIPSTWAAYAVDGDGDGDRDWNDPADAIPTAARMLAANGATRGQAGIIRALLAYNRASWYVNDVLTWAGQYASGKAAAPLGAAVATACAPAAGGGGPVAAVGGQQVVANGRVVLAHACQADDLRNGRIDPRVTASLAWLAQRHTLRVSALECDHSTLTVEGRTSNHSAGRAADVDMVDGVPCHGTASEPCGRAVLELAGVQGPMRSTELIYCFDPDGPADPRGFARSDHCGHLHLGFDAG